jgi:hypothetical protein
MIAASDSWHDSGRDRASDTAPGTGGLTVTGGGLPVDESAASLSEPPRARAVPGSASGRRPVPAIMACPGRPARRPPGLRLSRS